MQLRGLPRLSAGSGVYFGQLLGMADHLTFLLGAHGYRAYKVIGGFRSAAIFFVFQTHTLCEPKRENVGGREE